jgi:hypothetical protein
MGLGHGASIVRSGLVLHLDAANKKSYPGTGTAWNDMSGNSNNGTLVNSVGYSSNNSGSMVFDGIDDYCDAGTSSTLKPSYMTVSTWIKFTTISANNRILSDWHQNASSDRWIFYTANTTQVQWYIHTSIGGDVGIPFTINLNQWYYLTGTFDGTNTILYVNGDFVSSASKSGVLVSGLGESVRVGRQAESGGSHNGSIASVKMYNRALSAAEVKQNFNALRGRYGI